MSRWAERLHAIYDTVTRDTVDSVDTVDSADTPAATVPDGNSVNSVNSVTCHDDKKANFTPFMDGYFLAGLMRPTSWADPDARPSPGCYCSCCKSKHWWTERTEPKGWRCSSCHPPTGLEPDQVEKVRTTNGRDGPRQEQMPSPGSMHGERHRAANDSVPPREPEAAS